MSLTPEQQQRRQGKIGASFVPWLMAGDEKHMVSEWMRLVDHPDYVHLDLSKEWGPSFGSIVEPFALDWHERRTGHALTRRGEWVEHPQYGYIGCTLDSYREADRCVLDCKVLSRWSNLDEQRAFYTPQLLVQCRSVKAQLAAFLIVYGGEEPQEYPAGWDPEYERQVWQRVAWFWDRVESLQPPCALPSVKGQVPTIRSYDFTGNNEWASHAGNWLDNKEAADCFNRAAKSLKGLVPEDAVKAFGHGICCTRSRAGALSIKGADK